MFTQPTGYKNVLQKRFTGLLLEMLSAPRPGLDLSPSNHLIVSTSLFR